jgi:hypothetical protein
MFSYYLFGENLRAELGIIDDHEIMYFVGPDGKMSPAEVPKLLLETEVGRPGEFPRYRPAYYLLRIGEAFIWGTNPFLWYLARLLNVAILSSILWFLFQSCIGFTPGGLLLLYIFTFPTWGDIYTRLGPSEIYASLGTAMFALGFFTFTTRQQGNDFWQTGFVDWTLVVLGSLVAIGSKENFLLLVPLGWLLLLLAYKRKQGRVIGTLSIAIIMAYAGFVAWAAYSAVARRGLTIRAESTALSDRMDIALTGIQTAPSQVMIFMILILAVLWFLIRENKNLGGIVLTTLGMVVGCYLAYQSQYVFYNGDWPVGNRYDVPGIFSYKPLFFLATAWFVIKMLRAIRPQRETHVGLKAGLIVGLALIITPANFTVLREQSSANAQRTKAFAIQVNHVAELLKQNPDAALVVESHRPIDFEAAFTAWPRFLRANGVTNPFFLRLRNYSPETVAPGRPQVLAALLETISREGRGHVSPLSEFESRQSACYSLQLSGKSVTECTDLN